MNEADVLLALHATERDVSGRVRRIVELAPVLVSRGVSPGRLARERSVRRLSGEESANYEMIRNAFADAGPEHDPSADAVRRAGVAMFERARDNALAEERRRHVSGELG